MNLNQLVRLSDNNNKQKNVLSKFDILWLTQYQTLKWTFDRCSPLQVINGRRLVKSGFAATLNSSLPRQLMIAPGKSTNLKFRNLNHKPTVVLKRFDKFQYPTDPNRYTLHYTVEWPCVTPNGLNWLDLLLKRWIWSPTRKMTWIGFPDNVRGSPYQASYR